MTAELEATNKRAGDLQEKIDGMSSVLTAMNERCHQLKDEKEANERAMKEAIKRADQADRQCVQLQADLEANKETTQNLQSQFDEVYTDLASIKALQENLDRKSQVSQPVNLVGSQRRNFAYFFYMVTDLSMCPESPSRPLICVHSC